MNKSPDVTIKVCVSEPMTVDVSYIALPVELAMQNMAKMLEMGLALQPCNSMYL